MDPNHSDVNNSNSNSVPPSNMPPLYEPNFPFHQPNNTNPPFPPEWHQNSYTPVSVTENYPVPQFEPTWLPPVSVTGNYPVPHFEPTWLPLVTNHPTNYLQGPISDSSFNIDSTSFQANSGQYIFSQTGRQDPNVVVFECQKCPAKFYNRHAFGGHMSSHSKLAKKLEISQSMMPTLNKPRHVANLIRASGGNDASAAASSKKRGSKKGKDVAIDEPKAKK